MSVSIQLSDIGMFGYIDIVETKECSPKVWQIPLGTPGMWRPLIRSVILLVARCAKYCVHSRSLFLMIKVLVFIDTET